MGGRGSENEKVGIKKGPWTPEEDVILLSYIQQHGPGNWRAVPSNTGLLRCSKSCRLRFTNYLRPGIKRGNFTPHEEGMIIHLQALLGNKWAAIASYLPQRTDNDIKNYWNTHLKNKFKRLDPQTALATTDISIVSNQKAKKHVSEEQNSNVYALSAENISRLLEGWKKRSSSANSSAAGSSAVNPILDGVDNNTKDELIHVNSYLDWEYTYTQNEDYQQSITIPAEEQIQDQINNANYPPLSFLAETWLSYENETMGQAQAQAEGSDTGTSLYFLTH